MSQNTLKILIRTVTFIICSPFLLPFAFYYYIEDRLDWAFEQGKYTPPKEPSLVDRLTNKHEITKCILNGESNIVGKLDDGNTVIINRSKNV